jgi:peptidoglycan-associated lipoprotein
MAAAFRGRDSILEGHADERGTREYNLALGAPGANGQDYLASLGVSGARIETIPTARNVPFASSSNDGCWSQNRRGVSTIKSGAVS